MAGFKMHITTSTVIGVGYGAGALAGFEFPLPTCLLATGLCSVSGMLPDIDSDSGVPLRESMAFAAAVVPMMMVDRFARLGLSVESMVLAGGIVYLMIRFGLAELLKRYTVHRGMFHSIPAAALAGEITFLVFANENEVLRYYVAGAVVLGYLSHLVLDELYSIEWYRGRFRFKSSFGTALKIWGDNMWANLSTYAKLGLLTFVMLRDPVWMDELAPQASRIQNAANDVLNQLLR